MRRSAIQQLYCYYCCCGVPLDFSSATRGFTYWRRKAPDSPVRVFSVNMARSVFYETFIFYFLFFIFYFPFFIFGTSLIPDTGPFGTKKKKKKAGSISGRPRRFLLPITPHKERCKLQVCTHSKVRLRDAFFKVYRSDLVEVETALRQQGKSDAEIETMKEQNWDYFMSLCRR